MERITLTLQSKSMDCFLWTGFYMIETFIVKDLNTLQPSSFQFQLSPTFFSNRLLSSRLFLIQLKKNNLEFVFKGINKPLAKSCFYI